MLGSLSKTYAMTGWRAGCALGPKPIIAAMSKLQSQSTSSTASFVQKAAVAALNRSQECVAEMRADYLKLRDRILGRLTEIPGVTCTKPEGAFYVYPNVGASSASRELRRRWKWLRVCSMKRTWSRFRVRRLERSSISGCRMRFRITMWKRAWTG